MQKCLSGELSLLPVGGPPKLFSSKKMQAKFSYDAYQNSEKTGLEY